MVQWLRLKAWWKMANAHNIFPRGDRKKRRPFHKIMQIIPGNQEIKIILCTQILILRLTKGKKRHLIHNFRQNLHLWIMIVMLLAITFNDKLDVYATHHLALPVRRSVRMSIDCIDQSVKLYFFHYFKSSLVISGHLNSI